MNKFDQENLNKIDKEILIQHTIFEGILGSTAYGLDKKGVSDIDKKAIVILPTNLQFRLGKEWETETLHNPDTEFHAAKKFITLGNTQNPTVLEMLAIEERFITVNTRWGQMLREALPLFLSQNCYNSFGGYAKQQLFRIKAGLEKLTSEDKMNHLADIIDRILMALPDRYPIIGNPIKLNEVYFDDEGQAEVNLSVHTDSINLRHLSGMVSELNNAQKTYNKTNNRNRRPEDKLGKHAMHLIRLLKMGIEVLLTGKLNVYRYEDREFLLKVRNMEFTWEEIFSIVDDLNRQLDEALKNTILPKETNYELINELYTNIMLDYHGFKTA